jgi:hypothetical protein
VDTAIVTLPSIPSRQPSDHHTGASSVDHSDDEYQPEDDSASNIGQIVLDDDLDPDSAGSSEGLAALLDDKPSAVSSASASDVWYFMIPASTSTPTDGPKEERPTGSYERPDAEMLECYLCRYIQSSFYFSSILNLSSLKNKSRPFTNGTTSSMRRHLRNEHNREWLVTCVSLKLKGWEDKAAELKELSPQTGDSELTKSVLAAIQPAWTLKGFLDLLIKWIVVDDQVWVNLLNASILNQSNRPILLLIAQSSEPSFYTVVVSFVMRISRTAVQSAGSSWRHSRILIGNSSQSYRCVYPQISSTTFLMCFVGITWSYFIHPAQVAFMAVTAHYITPGHGRPHQRAALVAFRKISGSHTGRNMARYMAKVLHDLRITHKACPLLLALMLLKLSASTDWPSYA